MADNSVRDLIISAYSDEGCFLGGGGKAAVYSLLDIDDYVMKINYTSREQLGSFLNTSMLKPVKQIFGTHNLGMAMLNTGMTMYADGAVSSVSILQRQEGKSLENIYNEYLGKSRHCWHSMLPRYEDVYTQYLKFISEIEPPAYRNVVKDLSMLDRMDYHCDPAFGNILYSGDKLSLVDSVAYLDKVRNSSPHMLLHLTATALSMQFKKYKQENKESIRGYRRTIIGKVVDAMMQEGVPNDLKTHSLADKRTEKLLEESELTLIGLGKFAYCNKILEQRKQSIQQDWLNLVHQKSADLVRDIAPVNYSDPVETMVERLEQVKATQKEIDKLHGERGFER